MKILPLIYRRQTSVVNKKAATFGVITLITYLIPENSEIELSVSARDFMIDWGDGVCDKNMIHTYTRKGEYVIRICGECINELRVPKCCLENIDVSFCKWLEHLDCSFNWIVGYIRTILFGLFGLFSQCVKQFENRKSGISALSRQFR